jgi:hypothetical protein
LAAYRLTCSSISSALRTLPAIHNPEARIACIDGSIRTFKQHLLLAQRQRCSRESLVMIRILPKSRHGGAAIAGTEAETQPRFELFAVMRSEECRALADSLPRTFAIAQGHNAFRATRATYAESRIPEVSTPTHWSH